MPNNYLYCLISGFLVAVYHLIDKPWLISGFYNGMNVIFCKFVKVDLNVPLLHCLVIDTRKESRNMYVTFMH